jgi:nucleoside-diphosphate-sugar epimerase
MANWRSYGVDVRIARLFNTYGLRSRSDDGQMVPTFCVQALSGQPLTIFGSGMQTRSLCYVTDTVGGLIALMETPGLDGEVVNLGCPEERTILDIAQTIAAFGGEFVPHRTGTVASRRSSPALPGHRQSPAYAGMAARDRPQDRAGADAGLFPRGSCPLPRRGRVTYRALIPGTSPPGAGDHFLALEQRRRAERSGQVDPPQPTRFKRFARAE